MDLIRSYFSLIQTIQEATLAILSEPVSGFNDTHAYFANLYKVPHFSLNFTKQSANFILGDFDLKTLHTNQDLSLPAMLLSHVATQDLGETYGGNFSGQIQFKLSVVHILEETVNINMLELAANAIHDTIYNIFNCESNWPMYNGFGVTFNHKIAMASEDPLSNVVEDSGIVTQKLNFSLGFTKISF